MYNTIIKILSSFFAIFVMGIYSVVGASDFVFKSPLQIVSQNASSVTISWEDLPGATGYIVMYGSASNSQGFYENELPEVIEGNQATISGLTAGQVLYVAVSAVDSNFEDAALSEELQVTIGASSEGATSSFSVERAQVISELELKVTFNNPVEDYETSFREFLITEKDDKSAELFVVGSRVENNDVIIELGSPLVENKEYELVVVSVSDVNGNTIQSGADGMVTFVSNISGSMSSEVGTGNISSDIVNDFMNEMTGDISYDSAQDVAVTTTESTTEIDVETAAAEASSLPQTGAKEIMILLLALLLGGIVVFLRKRA